MTASSAGRGSTRRARAMEHRLPVRDWLDPDAPTHNPLPAARRIPTWSRRPTSQGHRARWRRPPRSWAYETQSTSSTATSGFAAAFRHEYVTAPVASRTNRDRVRTGHHVRHPRRRPAAEGRRAAGRDRRRGGLPHLDRFRRHPAGRRRAERHGSPRRAYRLLMEKGVPSFLYPVTQGATTIWERWDSVLPDGTLNSPA